MKILPALAALLTPAVAMAHGVHVAPVDGHSHGLWPVLLVAGLLAAAAAAIVWARRR